MHKEFSEKYHSMKNDIENIKTNHSEMNNRIPKMKSTREGINSR